MVPNGTVISFYTPLCYRWCENVRGGPGDNVLISYGRISCGWKCCKRTSDACIDKNGEVQLSNVTHKSTGGSCFGAPQSECNGKLIGDCEHLCR